MTDYEQNLYKQFSQEANRRRLDSGRILEEASNVAQRHTTTTTITLEQATSYKRIQLIALEQFAKEQFCIHAW
jgi:hypothetical protein